MHKGTVYLDVDGVLLDYTTPFLNYLNTHYFNPGVTYETLDTYHLSTLFTEDSDDAKYGLSAQGKCAAAMLDFHNSDEFGNLPPILHPLFLHSLTNAGLELKIITKLPNSNAMMRLSRLGNLTKFFGGVFSEIIVTSHEDKLDLIKGRMHSAEKVWLVEDNPTLLLNAEAREDLPFKVLAVEHPYNQKDLVSLNRVQLFKNPSLAVQSILLEVV